MWNFDFENGILLVGRYVWERMFLELMREIEVLRFLFFVSEIEVLNECLDFVVVVECIDVIFSMIISLGMMDCMILDDIDSDKFESGKCYLGKFVR